MNAPCPHCNTVFRVDPEKVPAGGARVRCSLCRGVFQVSGGQAAPAEAVTPATGGTAAPPAQAAGAATPPSPTAPATSPAAPAAAPRGGAPRFGAADPSAKARRLARALVSDMVTYHPDRREAALRDGTLKREFMEEIKKSWEEYVLQVGRETAQGTPHFRDALNDILARGQKVF